MARTGGLRQVHLDDWVSKRDTATHIKKTAQDPSLYTPPRKNSNTTQPTHVVWEHRGVQPQILRGGLEPLPAQRREHVPQELEVALRIPYLVGWGVGGGLDGWWWLTGAWDGSAARTRAWRGGCQSIRLLPYTIPCRISPTYPTPAIIPSSRTNQARPAHA